MFLWGRAGAGREIIAALRKSMVSRCGSGIRPGYLKHGRADGGAGGRGCGQSGEWVRSVGRAVGSTAARRCKRAKAQSDGWYRKGEREREKRFFWGAGG